MRFAIAILTGILALGATGAAGQTPGTPTVHVGLFVAGSDGKPEAIASRTAGREGRTIAGSLYLAACEMVGSVDSAAVVSAAATDVWEITARILELRPEGATVEMRWRRARRSGRDETSAPRSMTLTLSRGEVRTLEESETAPGTCGSQTAALNVAFATREELREIDMRASARRPGAELWLVRSAPGRADETQHLTLPVASVPHPFAFAPLAVEASVGTIAVVIDGTLAVVGENNRERRLHFTTRRMVTPFGRAPARAEVEGSATMTMAVPRPDEVLSFEMPPLRDASGAPLPDRLSMRIRLASD